MASPPAAPGERSALTQSAKVQNPRELFRDVTRLQMATPPSDVRAKTATPETLRMQSSEEIPRDVSRLQAPFPPADRSGRTTVLPTANVEQPGKPIQNIALSESQTSDESFLSAVNRDPLTPGTITEKPAAVQTPSTAQSVGDISLDSSNTIPPRPMPAENNTLTHAMKNAGNGAKNTLEKTAEIATATGEATPTVEAGRFDALRIPSSDFRNQTQALTPENGSLPTDIEKKSIGSTTVDGEATSALSANRSFDPVKLPEGYDREQTRNTMLSSGRSSNTLQEPETTPDAQNIVLQNTKDVASRSEIDRAVEQPVRSNPLKDLIQPTSNLQEPDSGQSDAQKSPTDSRPGIAEPKTSAQTPVSQEALPSAPKPNFQNSVERLAKSTVLNETTAAKNASVSQEVAEPATRSTSIEPNSSEAPTQKNPAKAVLTAQTFDQSPRQDQDQERTPLWFKDGAQMISMPAASSADRTADLFAGYASSLTTELAQRIQELHQQKRHELTLELEPKHLGRLVVTIGTDDNQVKTVITAESEQVKELLNRSAPQLRQELASQGLVLEKLQIDVNSQNAAQDHSFQHRNPGRRNNGLNQKHTPSTTGLAEAGVRRIHVGNTETLISLFV